MPTPTARLPLPSVRNGFWLSLRRPALPGSFRPGLLKPPGGHASRLSANSTTPKARACFSHELRADLAGRLPTATPPPALVPSGGCRAIPRGSTQSLTEGAAYPPQSPAPFSSNPSMTRRDTTLLPHPKVHMYCVFRTPS